MTQKFSNILKALLLTVLFTALTVSCKDDNPTPVGNGSQSGFTVIIPENIDLISGGTITISQEGGSITTSEKIYLETNGKFTPCNITDASDEHFTFAVPNNIESGTYTLHVTKNGKRTLLGQIKITIVAHQIPIPEGATVYGIIETEDGERVANVVVSDGENCTVTNSDGIYGIASEKNQGYVFLSVPSGYEPLTEGVFPKMYQKTVLSKGIPENISFKLKKTVGQDNFTILYMGDKHVANRSQDILQYKKFLADVTAYKGNHSSEKIYAITLGDLTWDQYWKNGYELPNYVKTINENLKDMIVYNVIGNHDHDPKSIGSNKSATNPMLTHVAPAWYSFNIGKAHFVVIDNIDCIAYDGVQDRPYTQNVYEPQIEWLKKDLSYIDKSTPVYVMTHGSLFSYNTSNPKAYNLRANTGSDKLIEACTGYEVHFVNGHLHQQHTMLPTDSPANGYSHPVYEHNIPAVCADWWYSGYYTPGCHITTDGVPAGYAIFEFSGKNMKWGYKGTGMDEKVQFRAYDLNNVDFSNVTWKNLKDSKVIAEFNKRYVTPYADGKRKNKVLINVWNWNNDCTIEVKTVNGETLAAKQVREYDPLSIAALSVPYWDRDALTSIPGTGTTLRYHFFQVQCNDADTDLEITVTDKFGNTYKEKMERPRPFSTEEYKIK